MWQAKVRGRRTFALGASWLQHEQEDALPRCDQKMAERHIGQLGGHQGDHEDVEQNVSSPTMLLLELRSHLEFIKCCKIQK